MQEISWDKPGGVGGEEARGIPMGKHIHVWAARTEVLITHEKNPTEVLFRHQLPVTKPD